MNIYKVLNEITAYIEENIEEKIDYEVLARMMAVNSYTMQRIFSVLVGVPLSEYIRKRKLSKAAFDLLNSDIKVMDVAIKYGYDSATSFSRAFEAFHEIKPSLVNKDTKLKEFPRPIFNEDIHNSADIEYSIVTLPELHLYGIGIKTNNNSVQNDAPSFFRETQQKYREYGLIKYGMTTYKDIERYYPDYYYCLFDKKVPGFESIIVSESKYLKFTIPSQEAKDIQETTQKFYKEFLPSCKYNLKDTPELEYYHDDITDFFVPIY